ncbi:epsin-2 isoform X2 [Agrilus planipennis]|uniref:Epsin-2 isoform X2 n=1 Tax=Agrilus planipennis TaxID=224129 RepID=A0A7F5RJ62_AGRPL|nr:epsin-2 isoform X2 [Agrilus planipennis]
MQVNVAGLRRNLKNIAHNYSDAQKKVREATSNDPWGPSSTLMAEIADLTYNVVAFTEIMQMIWKRLNDHGRNWRHVYKALVLLEYLIKTGSEKVGQQCKENIFAIQTLKDFQYLEEGKDQGQNVREKAKVLVNLLKDDERLKNERARALKAKERFAQTASAFGSDGGLDTPSSPKYPAFGGGSWSSSKDSVELPKELELARPQTAGEEELQLQLALAMSREEAEQEEQKKRSDDVRLQMALSQSQQDFKEEQEKHKGNQSHMLDLLDVNLGSEAAAIANNDPWSLSQPPPRPQPSGVDPWQPVTGVKSLGGSPWIAPPISAHSPPIPPTSSAVPLDRNVAAAARADPWSPASQSSSTDLEDFDAITNRTQSPKVNGTSNNNDVNGSNGTADPFELNLLNENLPSPGPSPSTGATKKTPQAFLGDNAALVNLDNLVTPSKPSTLSSAVANPFSDPTPPKPSINQIKQVPFQPAQFTPTSTPAYPTSGLGVAYVPPQPTSPYAISPQFATSATSVPFASPTTFGPTGSAGQPTNDPWAPIGTSASPWGVKPREQANPFLS